MSEFFWRAKQYFRLGDAIVEEHAYEINEIPHESALHAFVATSKIGKRLFDIPILSVATTSRTLLHTKVWIAGFTIAEANDLKSDFLGTNRSFQIVFVDFPRTSDRAVSFRLSTAGLKGYTEYRICFRRIDCDTFFCTE